MNANKPAKGSAWLGRIRPVRLICTVFVAVAMFMLAAENSPSYRTPKSNLTYSIAASVEAPVAYPALKPNAFWASIQ